MMMNGSGLKQIVQRLGIELRERVVEADYCFGTLEAFVIGIIFGKGEGATRTSEGLYWMV